MEERRVVFCERGAISSSVCGERAGVKSTKSPKGSGDSELETLY